MTEAWGDLTVREAFGEAARAYAELVRSIPPGSWDGPGLGEWSVRDLVGHTSRALITVETYLQQPAEIEDVSTPAGYLAALGAVDAAAVAARGREAGRALGDDPMATIEALIDRVLPLVDRDDNPLITTAAGGMRLDSYLPTRTFELVVHGFDIAAATSIEPPDLQRTVAQPGRRHRRDRCGDPRLRSGASPCAHRPPVAPVGFLNRLTDLHVLCMHDRCPPDSRRPRRGARCIG